MRGARQRSVAAVSLAFALALGACAASDADPAPSAASAGGGTPSDDGASEGGLAVVAVAPKADDLDGATARLRDELGRALVVSPVGCFEGLPPEAGDGYLVGAVADDPAAAAALVAEAGEPLLFSASVTILCVD